VTQPVVGHNVGFDLGFIEEAKGDGFRFAPGSYLDTLVIAREGYPGAESYKLGDLARFFGIELAQSHRALSDAQATANLLLWFANDLPDRISKLKTAIADAVRANRKGGDTNALLEAARRDARVSKNLFSLIQKKTGPPGRARRGHPDRRPRPDRHPTDHGRGRARPARPRLGPVHPR
jgi:DNA polymerase III epsilon subunit-like protein